ncbi:MAG: hypothetical protein KIS78_13225 [Labilithrix sp.]|nr:hypothetical protein [Labilithrix sp.]
MVAVPAVARGSLLAYRVFDACDTIALDVAERIVPSAKRVELGGPLAEGLVIAVPAVEIALAPCELVIPGIDGPLHARVSARIFHFGVISVLYEIPLESGTSLGSIVPVCAALYESAALDARGARHLEEIVGALSTSVEKPHEWDENESYTIVFVEQLAGAGGVESLVDSETVAKLLLGEVSERPLGAGTRQEVLRDGFSYLTDDLVVIDWNSALVVEPSGSRLVPHVLELATCQLLEFRYYDGLLDRELARVYDLVGRTPRILRSPFGALTRHVLRSFMELTEFTERVDNAIKSVGDVYLARVYLAAINRFRVPHWRESVETKLGLVGRAYELLKGEVEVSRAQALELIIVILILAELVAAIQRH